MVSSSTAMRLAKNRRGKSIRWKHRLMELCKGKFRLKVPECDSDNRKMASANLGFTLNHWSKPLCSALEIFPDRMFIKHTSVREMFLRSRLVCSSLVKREEEVEDLTDSRGRLKCCRTCVCREERQSIYS